MQSSDKYLKVYPPLECERCGVISDVVICYHQNTMYSDKESNYATLCPDCKQDNDDHWEEMWKCYYSDRL